MLNVMLTGVGGQGTVLAAKVLAQAAQEKGWHVRTAETIGMAQRGGSVVSHVRMGDDGEEVYSPLMAHASADMIIAFEPGEGARVLSYLAPGGALVTATSGVNPVSAALSPTPYSPADIVAHLERSFIACPDRLVIVADDEIARAVGSRKVLNTALLASAIASGKLPLSLDDLRNAIHACVKPRFIDLNLQVVDYVAG